MNLHVLGVCGTFMGGLAVLAKECGFTVSGSDANVYPPMSTQLEEQGIALCQGYAAEHLEPPPDMVVVGNAMSRGNPAVEHMLDTGMCYTSGPQWLADHLLAKRHVLAVSGTHGKTTTSSMLAWILEYAGLNPGFLIGGVPKNFGISARLGGDRYFVIEADEYDTAFFDKRSKFLHYRPRTLIINNVEFDHADIFPNLEAIQRQFHHLIRTVPGSGLVIRPNKDRAVDAIMAQGLWTPTETFGPDASQWTYQAQSPDVSELTVFLNGTPVGTINWSSIGDHNAFNGMAAIAAARHVGVAPATACKALGEFQGVKRRLEKIADVRGIAVYDDFAHHPTEIAASVTAMRRRIGNSRLIAVFEPRSNTMRLGSHQNEIAQAFKAADLSIFFQPPRLDWDLPGATAPLGAHRVIFDDLDSLIAHLAKTLSPDDHCLIMSNGGFGGIHGKLIARLSNA